MPAPVAQDYNLIKTNFTAGELSPRMVGHIDLDKYVQGCDTLENWLIYPQGGIYRRPGMRFVCPTKFSGTHEVHLLPFRFSSVQNYIIEIGDLYARFYRNGGQIQSSGVPIEIVTPYAEADTNLVKYAQSADTLYLAHGTYHPQKLTRTSDTVWMINRIDFLDGPYLDANLVSTAILTPSATANPAGTAITNAVNNGSGLIRITAAGHGLSTSNWVKVSGVQGTTEANGYWIITVIDVNTFDLTASAFVHTYTSGGLVQLLPTITASGTNTNGTAFSPFVNGPTLVSGQFANSGNGHVGSSWRFSSAGTTFGWFKIINVNGLTAVIDIRKSFDATTGSSFWREGAWSGVRGYPVCNTIKDQRLIWADNANEPQKMWASRVNDYENHVPQFTAGTTVDSDAWIYKLGTQQVNAIMWMTDSSRGLLVGTTGEEHIGSGSSGTGPITPNSVWFRVQTSYGSVNTVLPVRVGFETLFVTRTGLKLRAAAYNLLQDVYIAPDRTIFSEHISYLNSTNPGFAHMFYQQEPNSDIWLARYDGVLCVLTYVPEQNIAGWSRHTMEGGLASIQALCVIPATNLATDTIWAVIQRTVNGTQVRYIEYFDPIVHTDSALTVDNTQLTSTVTLSQTTPGTGITATASSGVFSAGNVGQEIVALPAPSGTLYPIPGFQVPIIPGLVPALQSGGSGRATITGFTDSTHVTVTVTNTFANATVLAGQWGFGSFSFSGLSSLEGKTVNLVGDGAVYPSVLVTGGVIQVPTGQPSIVSAEIGLPFTSTFVSMRPDPKSGGETVQADRKRWDKIKVRVQSTTDIVVDGTELTPRDFTQAAGVPPQPFTGDMLLPNASFYDFDGKITITQSNPVFTSIHAIFGRLDVGPI